MSSAFSKILVRGEKSKLNEASSLKSNNNKIEMQVLIK